MPKKDATTCMSYLICVSPGWPWLVYCRSYQVVLSSFLTLSCCRPVVHVNAIDESTRPVESMSAAAALSPTTQPSSYVDALALEWWKVYTARRTREAEQ